MPSTISLSRLIELQERFRTRKFRRHAVLGFSYNLWAQQRKMPERQRRSWGLKSCCTFSCLRPSSSDEHSQIGGRGYTRIVYCNDPDRNTNYRNNYVSTTKYNAVNFIPKSLFEQFRRVANIYFLVVACVSFSPLAPYTAVSVLLPLIVVIGVAMAKDALEDWRRMKQDKEANSREAKVYDKKSNKFYTTTWQKIRVGDVVKVQKNQYFPADLVLLSSNYEEGICYVDTANLDGETNLKVKNALEETTDLYGESKFQHFEAIIECEDPNEKLYSFVGTLDYCGRKHPLSLKQLLLRDSKLRNTDCAYGVAVFTGHETKVMQNATDVPSKRSKIERRMDKIIYVLFSILMAISLTGSFFFGIETEKDIRDGDIRRWYLQPDKTTVFYDPKRAILAAFLHFLTGLMLYGYLIPISLYVSIEVVKVLQSIFINRDYHMYYEETNRPARAHTSSLNEELGQVDTVLSDKTGTLTCNSMEFVKCSIAGTAYGRGMTDVEIDMAKRRGAQIDSSLENEARQSGRKVKGFNFRDERLLDGNWVNEPHPDIIQKFLRVLAICHTAFPQRHEDGDIFYEVESPDEAAFVTAAREFGFEFYSRTPKDIVVREPAVDIPIEVERIPKGRQLNELDNDIPAESGSPRGILLQEIDNAPKFKREYHLLRVLEYTSSRKRMSVIVRNRENEILLLSKGADSVMFAKLAEHGREFLKETKDHIDEYAKSGLRTMVIAYRKIDEEEYKRWEEKFLTIKTSLDEKRDELLEAAADEIERNLILLGATAVEDKLQKGVSECIDKLRKAGIKIWLITGDKMETAINIGYSCRLLELGMNLITISSDEITELEKQGLKEGAAKDSFQSVKKQIDTGKSMVMSTSGSSKFSLIIDGNSLTSALDSRLEDSFFDLAVDCATVICCRSSPKQKAHVARMVKTRTGKTILAIGDGANDVGMIHEADIGVGISGAEGMQAVMASDFSIAQFRFLERLLLVHGHWCYRRLSMMICYFFYKNIAFGLTLFWFEAHASFSGEPAYNDWYMSVYNVFFTSLPVIALGVFDQDVSDTECLQHEMLYQEGVKNNLFSWVRILGWMANGLVSSVIIFFFTTKVIIPQSFTRHGRVADFPEMAATMYTCVVWVVNCQMALSINYFTLIQHLFIWGSIALWYIFLIFYGSISPNFSTTAFQVFTEACAPSPLYWIVTLLAVFACLLPYYTCRAFQVRLCPMYHEKIQLGLLRWSGSNGAENRSIDIAGSDSEACIELQIQGG